MGKGRRNYSDNDKASALVALDLNSGNLRKTADELGIPFTTLQRWKNGNAISDDVPDLRTEKKETLADLFEAIVRRYAARALEDEAVNETRGKDAVIAAATAADKVQLLSGKPTERLAVTAELSDDELEKIISGRE